MISYRLDRPGKTPLIFNMPAVGGVISVGSAPLYVGGRLGGSRKLRVTLSPARLKQPDYAYKALKRAADLWHAQHVAVTDVGPFLYGTHAPRINAAFFDCAGYAGRVSFQSSKPIAAALYIGIEQSRKVKNLILYRGWSRTGKAPRLTPGVILQHVDALLGGHGVEYRPPHGFEDYTLTPRGVSYSNAGDDYSMTVLYDHIIDCFFVATLADYIQNDNRFLTEQTGV